MRVASPASTIWAHDARETTEQKSDEVRQRDGLEWGTPMTRTVILAGARTPIGRLSGAFASKRASELASVTIADSLRRGAIGADAVDYVVMGHVLSAGQGQLPGRQAAVQAGISMDVPVTMINKMCLSGLNAIHLADLMIRAGEAEIVIAGGMESMSQAPYVLAGARGGLAFGNQEIGDVIMVDGLTCAFDEVPMGAATDTYTGSSITREEQDEFAARSHERAAAGAKQLADEIVAVEVVPRRGEAVVVDQDEGVRAGTTAEALARLRPAFDPAGSITAGNASQISDGAASVIVTTLEHADALGVLPLAEIIGFGQVAGPNPSLLNQPSRAIRDALERSGNTLADIGLFEINEAFAAVAIASQRDLGIPDDVLNVNGGAIALGHPIGMSGTRLALTLAHELQRRGGGIGAAALCGGGGQGEAVLLRTIR